MLKPIFHRKRTLRDVAKAASVSLSTASNALNGVGRVNAEMSERINHIAQEIGFRPNALARSLLSKRSSTIGMLTDDTCGRLTLPMRAGGSEVLVDQGVSVFLCATDNDPRFSQLHLQALLDKQVDGIIFTATRLELKQPPELLALPIPVIYAFAEGPPGSISFVPDDAQGARLAMEHLKKTGCSRILHITGPNDYWPRGCARRSTAILPRRTAHRWLESGPRNGGMRQSRALPLKAANCRTEYSAVMTR